MSTCYNTVLAPFFLLELPRHRAGGMWPTHFLYLLNTHIIFNLQMSISCRYAVLPNLANRTAGFHFVSKLPNLRHGIIIRLYHAGNDIHRRFPPLPESASFAILGMVLSCSRREAFTRRSGKPNSVRNICPCKWPCCLFQQLQRSILPTSSTDYLQFNSSSKSPY